MKIIPRIISFIAWLQIAAAPTVAGMVTGFIVYKRYQTNTGFFTGLCIAMVGVITGVVMATKIGRKHGAAQFMARVSATPELDNLDSNNKVLSDKSGQQ